MIKMIVQVPPGVGGGQAMMAQTPAGLMSIHVSHGLWAGKTFEFEMAPPQQPMLPQAIATPVMATVQAMPVHAMPVQPMQPVQPQVVHVHHVHQHASV